MIKIVIVDAQLLIREGIKLIIEQDSELEVVGFANNGFEALELCERFSPDLILMDIVMPEYDNVEGIQLIKAKHPYVKVIILTIYSDDKYILQALNSGADGYVLKNIKPGELNMVIKGTLNGLRIVHQNVYNTIKKLATNARSVNDTDKIHYKLTELEKEIIKLIVAGKDTKEIASSIHFSESRTKSLIAKIQKGLNVKNRIELAIHAVKNHLD